MEGGDHGERGQGRAGPFRHRAASGTVSPPPKGGMQVDMCWPWAAAVVASHGFALGHSGPWCCSVQIAGKSAHALLHNTEPALEPVW